MDTEKLQYLSSWARHQAEDIILPFWTSDYIVDHENGGFYGLVTKDMVASNDEARGLTLTGRMLFAFSTAYRVFHRSLYLEKAAYTCRYLLSYFRDKEYGGAFTTVSETGEVLGDDKPNYCEAFYIMGLSAFVRAVSDAKDRKDTPSLTYAKIDRELEETALSEALKTAYLMESKAKYGPSRYFNNMTRDWHKAEGMGFGKIKTRPSAAIHFPEDAIMFPHHLCQSYVQLYLCSGEPMILQALSEMIEFASTMMYDPARHCFKTILGPSGERYGTNQSFGHDCEISYLILKVADLVGNDKLTGQVKVVCEDVLHTILNRDFDPWGGLYNGCEFEGTAVKPDSLSPSHIWWAEAEAVTAMLCGYELTRDQKYLDACIRQADYLNRFFVNRTYGDWYSNVEVTEKGSKIVDGMHGTDKLNTGKCPFHNSQMCFEVIWRTQRMLQRVKE